jgi:hypothetical protein
MKYLKHINENEQEFVDIAIKCHLDCEIITDDVKYPDWKDATMDEKRTYVKTQIQEYVLDNLEMIVEKMMLTGTIITQYGHMRKVDRLRDYK